MPVRATKRGAERTPLHADWDVIVCGASFAGLAVCRELAGSGARVLMLDRYEVGERQTSACAAPTEWLHALGLEGSVRQTFSDLVIHTPIEDLPLDAAVDVLDVRLPRAVRPAARAGARRRVRHRQGRRTDGVHPAHRPRRPHRAADRRRPRLAARALQRAAGHPASRCAPVARAGGPPARLRRRPRAVARPRLRARGLLVELPGRATSCASASAPSSRATTSRSRRCAWPATSTSRPCATRATGSPTRCARPIEDDIFFVGDSAGHCLPTTAEGIRTALYFGLACGRELRLVLDGRQTRGQALTRYAGFCDEHRWAFTLAAARAALGRAR